MDNKFVIKDIWLLHAESFEEFGIAFVLDIKFKIIKTVDPQLNRIPSNFQMQKIRFIQIIELNI